MIFNDSKYNSDWSTKKLSELGSFSRGISKHRPRNDKILFENGVYPLVQTGDIKKANLFLNTYSQKYSEFGLMQSKLWDSGTLCITIAANIAESAILEYPMCFPDSIVGFNSYEDQSTELFMYYIFEFIKNSIRKSSSGSTQDNINIDYLTSLHFKIPELKIQNKITNLLSIIDKKIIINNKINDNLFNIAYSYFMHNFFKKTPNGTLLDIIDEQIKSKIQVNEVKGTKGKYPFFTSGQTIYESEEYVIDGRNCFLNTGGNADVKFYIGKSSYSTDTWCIKASNNMSDYLYLFLKSIEPELEKKFFEGTGLRHLQKDILKKRPLYIPNPDEINKFNLFIQPIFNDVSKNIKENQKLSKLRDWLLPMLINGQAKLD